MEQDWFCDFFPPKAQVEARLLWTQEQQHLDLLMYNEDLTFRWKGMQVVCSSSMEVAVLLSVTWFRGSPLLGPGDHALVWMVNQKG